jgi:AraC-like DNA-binding protein
MIVAFLRRPELHSGVRAAAMPEEDVFFEGDRARDALRRGFPRLLVLDEPDSASRSVSFRAAGPEVPVLRLVSPQGLFGARDAGSLVVTGVDDVRDLRRLIHRTAGDGSWVDRLFHDLVSVSGHTLPHAFRGLARRVMEYPAQYADLHAVARLTGLSRGALKARFRRRGLRSPSSHLRWLRALAAAHVLGEGATTVGETAFRLGFTSGGNLCRAVQAVTGSTPGELRQPGRREALTVSFAQQFLSRDARRGWLELSPIFLRRPTAA